MRIKGNNRTKVKNKIEINIRPRMSFQVKKGWKGILSMLNINPMGLDEPFSCRKKICIVIKINRIKGRIKWNEKNRDRVALSTENPPHNQYVISVPKKGIADKRLVMTVAPQNDICPHGRTYPRNDVAIRVRRMITPDDHTFLKLKEE